MKKEIVPVKLKANDHITIDQDAIAALDAAYEGAKIGSADTMLRDWYREKNIIDTTYEEVKPEQLSDGRENKES